MTNLISSFRERTEKNPLYLKHIYLYGNLDFLSIITFRENLRLSMDGIKKIIIFKQINKRTFYENLFLGTAI